MALDITPPKRDLPHSGHRRTNMRALWRLSGWGGVAALALAALAITAQTDIGGERLQLALAAPAEPARAIAAMPPRAPEKDAETRALEAQVRTLAADRDRLAARLASLERHLDDMTGSIQRASQPAPAPATSAPAAAPAPAASAPAPVPQIASIAPILAPPATTAVAAAPAPPVIDPLAMPAATATGASWPVTAQPKPQAEAVPETVPLPPNRLAALTPTERAPAQPAAPKHEFGIELATAPDLDLLRTRWTAVKANYGPLLTGLQPIAVHDRRPSSTSYRLIAGPLMNFAAAKQMCTRFTAAGAVCRPARFDPNSVVQR